MAWIKGRRAGGPPVRDQWDQPVPAAVMFRTTHPDDLPGTRIFAKDGTTALPLGSVTMAGAQVELVAVWDAQNKDHMTVVGLGLNPNGSVDPLFALRSGKKVTLGRSSAGRTIPIGQLIDADRPGAHKAQLSRQHCEVAWEEGWLKVVDLASGNGTAVVKRLGTAPPDELRKAFGEIEQPSPELITFMQTVEREWNYTAGIKQSDLGGDDKPALKRDGAILGSLMTVGTTRGGINEQVAITWCPEIEDAFAEIVRTLGEQQRKQGSLSDKDKVQAVYDHVHATMKYDKNRVETAMARRKDAQGVARFTLREFIQNGVGVCRHQAAYSGVLLELMIQRGLLQGTVSLDRNHRMMHDGVRGGHQWARFEGTDRAPTGPSPTDKVIICDVAQEKCDYLDVVRNAKDAWEWDRPGEMVIVAEGTRLLPALPNGGVIGI